MLKGEYPGGWIFGREFDFTETTATSRFRDAMFVAGRMRSGRVFLVGESVRVHYPASGVGMNFGLQDAFNLAGSSRRR